MALPADFPQPPKRPPASVATATPDGKITKPWSDYFDKLDRFNIAVRARLDSL